jgi:mycothiol system anti-sigma-R factor
MAIHCSDIETLVHTYLDGELADEDLREFEEHTDECTACHERVESEIEFRTDLRHRLAPPRAPGELRERLMLALDQEDAAQAQQVLRSRFAWVLPGVATFAAAAALVLFLTYDGRAPAGDPVAHDAVQAHMRQPPIEVTGASQVSPWIKRHFQASVEPPRFSTAGINLRGARLSHLRGRDAAHLFYEIDRGGRRSDVQVHILDGSDLSLEGATRRRVGGRELFVDGDLGYSVVTYRDPSGMAYVFTSDMSENELLDLVVSSDLLLKVDEDRGR